MRYRIVSPGRQMQGLNHLGSRAGKTLGAGLRFSNAGNRLIDSYLLKLETGLLTTAVLFVFTSSAKQSPGPRVLALLASCFSSGQFTFSCGYSELSSIDTLNQMRSTAIDVESTRVLQFFLRWPKPSSSASAP